MESAGLAKDLTTWQRLRRSHWWRIPATGIGFGLFGVGAAILSLSTFPLVYILPMKQQTKKKCARLIISWVFLYYIRSLRLLGLLTYELHNVEALRQPNQLIIANHPTLLDVVFIIALTGDTSCIVKGSLWHNPFTFFALHISGYISNSDSRLFELCLETLQQGNSLIIFPEGTRTRPGEPLKFHRGPSNIALSANMAITPVVIHCEPLTLLKNQKWHQISDAPPHFSIKVMPAFEVAHYMADGQLQSSASRQLTRDLVAYFEQQRQ